jgi:hypothetical protein
MDIFGAASGMGALPLLDLLRRGFQDPNFVSRLHEAMNDFMVLDSLRINPTIRSNPIERDTIEHTKLLRMQVNMSPIRIREQMLRAIDQPKRTTASRNEPYP